MTEKLYICPGETRPISRSVHLARLAAFYPGCRDCPLRHETGELPRHTLDRIHSTERRVGRKSLLTAEGLRGVYLNEITRRKAEQAAAALADLLWERRPLVGRRTVARASRPVPAGVGRDRRQPADGSDEQSAHGSGTPRYRSTAALPLVVIGHDERPSAPDLVTGVVRALRRMSCRVVDIGLATRPCFWFAVDHLQATAGILVAGSGCEPSWTGFDFMGPQDLECGDLSPLSCSSEPPDPARAFGLERLEQRMATALRRPSRQAGPCRLFQAAVPYEASLWKHFHALRPLVVCLAVASRPARRTLDKLFGTLPCRLVPVDVPVRARDVFAEDDADVARVAAAVRRARAHLGVLIDDDAQRTGFLDERGQLVPAATVTRLVSRLLLAEHPGGTVAVEHGAVSLLAADVEQDGGRVVDAGTTFADMARTMRAASAVVGGGTSGRLWFREFSGTTPGRPTCDAVLTLARILDVLSRSDAPFSLVADACRMP